jgi:microcystin-dependent protein
MADAFLGEIRLFGWNFAPVNWALCNGALMSISQNDALFAVIGVQYGGDGIQTFGLPNLQGCAAVGMGQGPGLQSWDVGETQGSDAVTLTTAQAPLHAHTMYARPATLEQTVAVPSATTMFGRFGGTAGLSLAWFAEDTPPSQTNMASQMLSVSGQSLPHENRQPFLAMNYCICTNGYFPSRS